MVFILSKHKKSQSVLKFNKKVQEPAAESSMTILILKISVLLKTMKLISSTIINKFLVLFIILPNIEEKQIRNLNTQNMTSVLKKALIWQAICSCGKKSAPYNSQSTLSGQIYVKECLQKRLLPLIKSHNNRPVFWPDLASIHYCKLAMERYKKNNVKFVPKTENPPNCQELRVG